MRGSAAFRTSVTPGGALAGPWVRNPLWNAARSVPSLDLRFADNKSLVDATTGQNLVTFTRASSGTYVDSQGVIRTATTNEARFDHNPTTGESLGLLVEEQRTNLLLQSEDFSTTWTATRASVSTNVISSPDGSNTADKLTEDTTASNTHFASQSVSITTGTSYTLSVFAKAGERNFLQLALSGQFATVISAIFDLTTGAVGTTTGSPVTSATQLSNGWWRFSITATATGTGTTSAIARTANSSSTSVYTGDGTSGIYIWGAQLEAGAFPTSYIPTTTAAVTRSADVASITGSNFGTFRTNLLLQSEDFSTTWANTESTEAINVETAPNGTLTADKLIPDVGVTSGQFRQDVSKAATSTTYTCSVYGKAAEFNRLSIRVEHNGSTGNRADVGFSLSDGSVVSAATAIGTFSGASSTATFVGAGWYRFTLSFTSSTETSLRIRLFGFDSSLPCNGTSGIYLWGAQLETGSTATAYIPTTTAAVTVFESSWYRQDEGTVYGEFDALSTSADRALTQLDDTGFTNRIFQLIQANNGYQVNAVVGGSSVGQMFPAGTYSSPILAKISHAYRVNDFAATVNGGAVSTDITGALPTVTQLRLGFDGGSARLNGHLRRLTYFPARLANSTLQQITQ